MIFISLPYTSKRAITTQNRVDIAEKLVLKLAEQNIIGMSAIVYYHNLIDKYKFGNISYEFWTKICLELLCNCSSVWVLKIDGWDKSTGVADEVKCAKELGLPIRYISLEELEEIIK